MIFNTKQNDPKIYRGRFAPSPSGKLHFGSLIAALASYLQAKANNGHWLVRIEDIDPPREQVGAADDILRTLECYGLEWDEPVLYQSNQHVLYCDILSWLHAQKLTYYCHCPRKRIKSLGGLYDGYCSERHQNSKDAAIRLRNLKPIDTFQDLIQGRVSTDKNFAEEDFIVHRKDGLFAYQLAVVADDIYQGITEVVRGCDLLTPTVRQINLTQLLSNAEIQYAHFPLAVTGEGYKLSKQNKAPAIDKNNPMPTLCNALTFLGLNPPRDLTESSPQAILGWACNNWRLSHIPQKQEILLNH